MKYILSLIISGALVVSGFGQTRNVLVGTNNAVVQPTNFWSADASNARTGLGLGSAATNPASAFQPSSTILSNLASSNGSGLTNISVFGVVGALTTNGNGAGLTNLTAANITGTVALASNLSSPLALTNGGTGTTNAETARTNLGLGWSALTNTDATNFRNAIGLGTTNNVTFESVSISGGNVSFSNESIYFGTNLIFAPEDASFSIPIVVVSNAVAQTRTNLGLPWSGLTNTNAATFQAALFGANTNPVLVNTNGEVVSPTNFWQAAPINTVLQNITNVVGNSTNAATNARMLFLYSLAPTVTNVTSTITLPTNGTTFGGDVATITHLGPTSSVTAIRALGASTNIITLNQIEESVRFIYRDNQWKLMDNISYIEPIFFSGTNAAANAAASRTNLGGTTIGNAVFTATNAATAAAAIELGETNNVTFSNVTASGTLTATSTVTAKTNLIVEGFLDFTTNHTNVAPATNNQIQKFLQIRIGTNAFFLPLYQ